jgi:uncharacterized membrane protein HdeD (DUF308 family)
MALVAGTVELARWWWTFILRGAIAIAFGVLAFVSPPATNAAIQDRSMTRTFWLGVLEGVVSIIAGVLALAFPDVAALSLLLIISAWSIVTGVVEVMMAIRLREQITGELWLALAGILSIVFGVLLFLFPTSGAITIVWIIGAYAIVFGIAMIALGWRLRGINQRVSDVTGG